MHSVSFSCGSKARSCERRWTSFECMACTMHGTARCTSLALQRHTQFLVLLLTCQLLFSFTSQLDEKDQELELAVNAATKEKAAWATKRKVRHVGRRSMRQAHSHTEYRLCCCSCLLKLQAGSCPSSSASAFPVLARLLKPWRHMVPLWPRQTSMNTRAHLHVVHIHAREVCD